MIHLKTPRGLDVAVPEQLSEDPSSRFDCDATQALKGYYEQHGYVIVKGLIPPSHCDAIRKLWDTDVKPFRGYMYRQATAKAERHRFNGNGWVMNPILNLQSVDPKHFAQFRRYATDNILAHAALRDVFSEFLGEPPKIVQSMYFEGNSATWEHQDSYYLDSECVGQMVAGWIAIEDIHPRAGRFFVCPGSQRMMLDDHGVLNNMAEHHDTYINSVVDNIRRNRLEIRAPVMDKGDVLFWNSRTIHGSLDSQDASHSRSSITCHAIPKSRRFLQLQTRAVDIKTDSLNGAEIFRPKDLRSLKNRLVLGIESTFPTPFYWAKRKAMVRLVSSKQATR